jgi:carbon-monoxide dehydrogenase large subunit
VIGQPVRRLEDARFLTGQGRFVADIAPPGALHVAFVRSPHAHARLRAIDVTSALAGPGVVACVTGEELHRRVRPLRAPSRMKTYKATDFPALALGKVRHVGEAVVAVVADSRYTAEDACDLVRVE